MDELMETHWSTQITHLFLCPTNSVSFWFLFRVIFITPVNNGHVDQLYFQTMTYQQWTMSYTEWSLYILHRV